MCGGQHTQPLTQPASLLRDHGGEMRRPCCCWLPQHQHHPRPESSSKDVPLLGYIPFAGPHTSTTGHLGSADSKAEASWKAHTTHSHPTLCPLQPTQGCSKSKGRVHAWFMPSSSKAVGLMDSCTTPGARSAASTSTVSGQKAQDLALASTHMIKARRCRDMAARGQQARGSSRRGISC